MTKEIGDNLLIDSWASAGAIVEPDLSKKEVGWLSGERPTFQNMNFLQNLYAKKINYILRSGVPEWDALTPYLEHDYVVQGGTLYQAIADNTGDAPPSANWLDVIRTTAERIVFDSTGLTNTAATDVQQAIADLDAAIDVIAATYNEYNLPLYSPVSWDFSWLPAKCVYHAGQTIGNAASGATYADDDLEAYFDFIKAEGAAFGNTGAEVFANGDTVFLPDRRGRVDAGKDNMGGTSANRLTGLSGGVNGDNLGAVGGSESVTQTSSTLFSHNHQLRGDTDNGSNCFRFFGLTPGDNNQNTENTGSSQAMNNVQPVIISNKIARYK